MGKGSVLLVSACLSASVFAQGSLTPPGAPGATMKTLDQLDEAIEGLAVDGRIPIDYAPFTITEPGSYYVTTNFATQTRSMITVRTNDVCVDLNGYTIEGNQYALQAIYIDECSNVQVKNGTLRNFYRSGIIAYNSDHCTFRDLTFIENGDSENNFDHFALKAGSNTIVENCVFRDNAVGGVFVLDNSRVVNNDIRGSGDTGLEVRESGSYVAGNIVRGNLLNYRFENGNELNLILSEVPETVYWPCSITFGGSLVCSATNKPAIYIKRDNVSIDMQGFTLEGAGSKNGIWQDPSYSGLRISNGTVRGFDESGIVLQGSNNVVRSVSAISNVGTGIGIGLNSSIVDCLAAGNGSTGIDGAANSSVLNCRSKGNGNIGIAVGAGSSVERCEVTGCKGESAIRVGINSSVKGCTVTDNQSDYGIFADYRSHVLNCSASGNTGTGTGESCGIYARPGSLVADCTTSGNSHTNHTNASQGCGIYAAAAMIRDCNASYNIGNGIQSSSDSHIVGNYCRANGYQVEGGAGIYASSADNRIDGNTVIDNDYGIRVSAAGNIITRNSASGNVDGDFEIIPGNDLGTVQTSPVGAGPWDNFSY